MDQTIARLNIEHYRTLLAGKLEETQRHTILDLLVQEEEKLALLVRAKVERAASY